MATETVRIKNIGLRGVTVADTKISYIDGENGVLIYRGYRIEELAEQSTFMETAFLLLNGRLPKESELERFERQVVQSRDLPGFVLESLEKFPKQRRSDGCAPGLRPDAGCRRPGTLRRLERGQCQEGYPAHSPFPRCGRRLASDQKRGEAASA